MVLIEKLNAIGDAIRAKTGGTEKLTLDQMPTEIASITTGDYSVPEEALVISGISDYRFYRGKWDWFIETFGDQITTANISRGNSMFERSNLKSIPFDLNFSGISSNGIGNITENMFDYCIELETIPKISNFAPYNITQMFKGCKKIKDIKPNVYSDWDWSCYYGKCNGIFDECASLRYLPMEFFTNYNATQNSPNPIYSLYHFYSCFCLDQIVDMPIPYVGQSWDYKSLSGAPRNSLFGQSFDNCYRLKRFTFATNNGQPITVQWSGQSIDFSTYVGYGSSLILNYVDANKEVKDAVTYQALQSDPDWWTLDVAYSRYNKTSAVETINSLPDAAVYLNTSDYSTNTIKFKGDAGSLTGGGAINTMTEEQIAVATAKGWTVAFA